VSNPARAGVHVGALTYEFRKVVEVDARLQRLGVMAGSKASLRNWSVTKSSITCGRDVMVVCCYCLLLRLLCELMVQFACVVNETTL
jgi:hypothetical protein